MNPTLPVPRPSVISTTLPTPAPRPSGSFSIIPRPSATSPSIPIPRPVASPSISVPRPIASPSISVPRPTTLSVQRPSVASPSISVPRPTTLSVQRPSVASPSIPVPRPVASPSVPVPRPITLSVPIPAPRPSAASPSIPVPRPVASPSVPVPRSTTLSVQRPATSGVGVGAQAPITFTPEMIAEDTVIALGNTLDQANFANLLEFLSDYYYNDQALVEDKIYDQLQDIYEAKYGPYTVVAAEPRGVKVKLPYYIGGLRKLKKDEELERWYTNYPGPYIIEDKIDGLTLLIVSRVEHGRRTTTIYTHGKNGFGKNVTHLLDYIRIPNWLRPNQPQIDHPLANDIAVRGEVVMTKADFQRVGANFKNSRNLTGGIVNAKKSLDLNLARELTFFAYRIVNDNTTPEQQIADLQALGFNVPSPVQSPTVNREMLANYFEMRKRDGPYDMDGLVLYQNRAELYPEGDAPRHVVAFKTETDSATTTVIEVVYESSKHWRLKPVIVYQPVQLSGVELRRASGYNGRYIVSNNIGPGAEILVTRSGDVIPRVISILKPAPGGPAWPDPQMFGAYDWDENQVDFVLREPDNQAISKMFTHFITTLDIKQFGPARTKLLVDHGVRTLTGLLSIRPEQLAAIPGIGPGVSNQFYTDLHAKISNVSAPEIMTASGFFKGIGRRRFESIFEALPNFLELARTEPDQIGTYIQNIKGFKELAIVIAEEMPDFLEWLDDHPAIRITDSIPLQAPAPFPTSSIPTQTPFSTAAPRPGLTLAIGQPAPTSSGAVQFAPTQPVTSNLTGMNVVFTGPRDKNLENDIRQRGGKVMTSVSGTTSVLIMKNLEDVMGKAADAIKRGIPRMTHEEFAQRYLQ